MTFQRAPYAAPYIAGNVNTEKNFRKYFGKKLKSLTSSAKHGRIPISPYRCKSLKTLTLLTHASMKSPIISLKKIEIMSTTSSLKRITGYKNLISLKISVFLFDLNLAFVSQLRQLVHLKYLSLKIELHLLAQGSRHFLGLKTLEHLDIEIIDERDEDSTKDQMIVRDLYFVLMRSKTLSYLRLNIRHVPLDSNSLALLFQTLSKVTIPHVLIDVHYRQEYNIDIKLLENALSNVDLFTIRCNSSSFFVSLSTNQENPHQSMIQARRKLNLYVSPRRFIKNQYVPRAQLSNPEITKNNFNLTESVKSIFCDTLDTSFSLFNTSKIKCIKAFGMSLKPFQEDKTLEGLKTLQAVIQNSPSLEHLEMSGANFGQQEVALILDELANLKQLETLQIRASEFPSDSENQYRKIASLTSLKKLHFDVRMSLDPNIFKSSFDFTSSSNLTELKINYPSHNPEDMLETIQKLSSLEKIIIMDMPVSTDERYVLRFLDRIYQLTQLREVCIFSERKYEGLSLSEAEVITMSKKLHGKVLDLLNKNKSIEKFLIKDETNSFEIQCIRY